MGKLIKTVTHNLIFFAIKEDVDQTYLHEKT